MSIEFDDLQPNRVAVRANQKAALELVNAALKGKPNIFEILVGIYSCYFSK